MKIALTFTFAALAATAALLPTTSALAQGRHSSDATPGFATLDRQSTSSMFSVDLSLTTFDDNFLDINAVGLTLHTTYFFSPTFGGYGTLPLTHVMIDEADDESALGNIEVGGVFAPSRQGSVGFLARTGVALPTADDEDFAAVFNAFTRVTDLVLFVPDTTSLRLSGSIFGGSGQLFWRGDLGLDVPFDTNDDADDLDPLVRLNFGGGIQTESVALMVELASVGTTGDTGDGEDRFFYTAGVSARFTAGSVQPMIGIATPLSNDLQNLVDFAFFFGLSSQIGR